MHTSAFRHLMLAAFVLSALGSGCSFDDSQFQHLTCVEDADCLPGHACTNGFCVVTADVLMDLAPPPDCGDVSCGAAERCCEGVCVDTTNDVLHCGACGEACRPGETCAAGQCSCAEGVACDEAQDCCDGTCVNTQFNPRNCGTCGNTCGALPLCVAGLCSCGSGQWECETGVCSDILSDPENCGGCGSTCDGNTTCIGSACSCGGDPCGSGENCCMAGDQVLCVDTSQSPTHCGGCSTTETPTRCKPREACVGGACSCNGGAGCGPGLQCCPDGCEVTCDCGGVECLEGWGCCDDGGGVACKNLDDDATHCGGCGITCDPGLVCVDGNCVCPAGQTNCDGVCVDVRQDADNCGRCGNACDGRTCCAGLCVDTETDIANCGGCSLACLGEAACIAGGCDCGEGPVDLENDPNNCGACGRTCFGGTCSGGACQCDGETVDLQSDPANCGGCSLSCGSGACQAGLCDCGAGPTDVLSDAEHCGACGHSCGNAACVDGVCDCGAGAQLGTDENCAACGDSCGSGTCVNGGCTCSGTAVDLATNRDHCGDCGRACPADAQCQARACTCGSGAVDFATSELHCGDCATACPAASTCLAGQCTCGGAVVDFDTNASHCGNCGVSCARPNATVGCVGGACNFNRASVTCAANFDDCNNNIQSDGCEAALLTSTAHCGTCGHACATDESCVAGACERVTVTVGAGEAHGCLLKRTDINGVFDRSEVWCWGAGGAGHFANGSTSSLNSPTRVDNASGSPLNGVVTQLSVGTGHTCFVVESGAVYCAGLNGDGQLGVNDGDHSSPVEVPGVSPALQVACGSNHTCALLDDNTVMCWGNNGEGQVGNGSVQNVTVAPAAVTGLTGVEQIDSGFKFTCALTDAGDVYCWGRNNQLQVGIASPNKVGSPNPVGVSSAAAQVACGAEHACAVLQSGGVECWGRNDKKQLTAATTATTSASPIVAYLDATTPLSGVQAIGAGWKHNCVIRLVGSERQAWCWGYNDDRQLGDNSTSDRSYPVRAGSSITNFRQLDGNSAASDADDFTCGARRTQISCWGNNNSRQLGDGTTNDAGTPVSWNIP